MYCAFATYLAITNAAATHVATKDIPIAPRIQIAKPDIHNSRGNFFRLLTIRIDTMTNPIAPKYSISTFSMISLGITSIKSVIGVVAKAVVPITKDSTVIPNKKNGTCFLHCVFSFLTDPFIDGNQMYIIKFK